MDFDEYLSEQDALLNITDIKYTNELEFMENFFKNDTEIGAKVYCQASFWLYSWKQNVISDQDDCINFKDSDDSWLNTLRKSLQQSEDLRAEGNRIFQSKNMNAKENRMVKAIRLYTEAIFAASKGYCLCRRLKERHSMEMYESNPEQKIETYADLLSLAYANRSIVLLKFGYIQEAYDDCCCSLNIGYRKVEKRYQIVWRQIICCNELQYIELMRKHLRELQDLLKQWSVPSRDRCQLDQDILKYELILQQQQRIYEESVHQKVPTVSNSSNRECQQM